VGEIELVRIEDEEYTLPADEPVPQWVVDAGLSPDVDSKVIGFPAYAIRAGDIRIVVDPWVVNDFPRTQPDAAEHADRLLGELADAGFPPDEVDVVVLTHVDGMGWLTRPDGEGGWTKTFPNARHLLPRVELDAVVGGDEWFASGRAAELVAAVDPEPADLPLALADGVTLVDAPGHNPGHLVVRIASGGEVATMAGHAFLAAHEIADHTPTGDDRPEIEATRRVILDDLAERGGVVHLPLVGGPAGGAGRVERDGGSYRLVSLRPPTP
jgi:glyoxylase-like metal-dependent hydrolase (beta-lactamase superfamily II)